jgi:hypothetical protein
MYERTYHNRVLKQPDEQKSKTRRGFSWKKILAVVVMLGCGVGTFFLLRAPRLQITTVDVSGTSVLDEYDISSFVMGSLAGKRAWFFPKTSVFLVSEHALEQTIKKAFSRIETVSVKRNTFHSLAVDIKEYRAVYLWCTDKPDDCYFMDSQGIVYSEAPVFSGTAYPKIITGAPLAALPFQGMSSIDVERVALLEKGLSDINIVPTVFKNVSVHEMEIDFLHNKRVARLLIDPSVPATTTLEYIFSGIRAEPLASLFHNSEKVLFYLDVRFSNKVVYKFQTNE